MRYEAHFIVIPEGTPAVVRGCAKCGAPMPFTPSGQFRINAQKKLLDVWLIYRCARCQSTWNFELMARVPPRAIPPVLLGRLLENDPELARAYAFDAALHREKGAPLNVDHLAYRIEGALPEMGEGGALLLTLTCPVPLGVRLRRLLCEALGISGGRFDALLAEGRIESLDGQNLAKARMGTLCRVVVRAC